MSDPRPSSNYKGSCIGFVAAKGACSPPATPIEVMGAALKRAVAARMDTDLDESWDPKIAAVLLKMFQETRKSKIA